MQKHPCMCEVARIVNHTSNLLLAVPPIALLDALL